MNNGEHKALEKNRNSDRETELAIKKELAADPQLLAVKEKVHEELSRCWSYLDEAGCALVEKAFEYAYLAHAGQKRLSGDPYIVHLAEVVKILAAYKLDAVAICTGLMHDLIEEKTGVELEDIKTEFGSEIASLVDGVTKLTNLFSRQEKAVSRLAERSKTGYEASIENLRKIFLAVSKDLRVILVKFADRLHNLRTLEFCEPDVQRTVAFETLDIFAPLASRLGVWEFKAEMENLAFRYAYPEDFQKLSRELEDVRPRFTAVMDKVVEALRERLAKLGIKNELEYRFKHLYSIYRKVLRTHKTLAEIYDLAAVRVLVPTVEDCYMVFGLVHSLWSPMNGRIKDYIARPKPNNYRCLHTTVLTPGDIPLEVQIRTFEMHRVNEVGVAAHWAYKEGKSGADKERGSMFAQLYPWIRALLDWHGDSSDSGRGEHLKVDLLNQDVFALTPGGDVIDLPKGSTPIDFAYRIHTEVGHHCVGAVVNHRMVPLTYKLANADVVEIQTSKNSTPSRDWLRVCASHQALAKIRNWFKKERRDENIVRGRDSLKAELKRLRLEELMGDDGLMLKAAQQLSFLNADDLLASIGYGETSALQAVSRLQSLRPKEETPAPLPPLPDEAAAAPAKNKSGGREILVENLDTVLTKMARCCTPVPGDAIIGYITVGSGVSVHRKNCVNFQHLTRNQPERIVQCTWNITEKQLNESQDGDKHAKNKQATRKTWWAYIEVGAWDRPGLVSDLLSQLNDLRIPVKSCQANTTADRARIKISVEVTGNKQLNEALKRLGGVKSVYQAERVAQGGRGRRK